MLLQQDDLDLDAVDDEGRTADAIADELQLHEIHEAIVDAQIMRFAKERLDAFNVSNFNYYTTASSQNRYQSLYRLNFYSQGANKFFHCGEWIWPQY